MKRNSLFLIAIVLVGFLIRVWGVSENPVSTYWDETAIGNDAYSLAETGKDMHGGGFWQAIFPSYGDYKLPLYIWLTTGLMKLFGPSVFALRLSSVLAGTALIVVLYFLAETLFKSKTAGLSAALLTALSPWVVHFSRAAFEANVGLLFIALVLLTLMRGFKQPQLFVLSGLFGALGVYSYFSVRIILPIMVGATMVIFWKQLTRRHLIWLAVGVCLFVGLLVPIYQSPLYAPSNQFRLSTPSLLNTDEHIRTQNEYRELARNSSVSRVLYHRYRFFMQRLVEQYSAHFNLGYVFLTGDPNLRHGSQFGLFLISALPLFIAGLLWLFQKKPWYLLMLLAWWAAGILPAAIPLSTPHALRSLNAFPAILLIITAGMVGLYQWQNRFKTVVTFAVVGVLMINFLVYWEDYWHHYPRRSAREWQYGYRQLAEYLTGEFNNFNYLKIDSTDPRLWLYILFYSKIDPAIAQANSANFEITTFSKYQFDRILEQDAYTYPLETLVVIPPESYDEFKRKPKLKSVITDYDGMPQFYIYEQRENVVPQD